MIAVVSPVAYTTSVATAAVLCTVLCAAARQHPGRWASTVARVVGVLLALDAVVWWTIVMPGRGDWSANSSLPLALCNMAVFVTAAACWWQTPLLVEVNYFWGMAGALQAILTPDLTSPFPDAEFFQYTWGHLAVVIMALYLVIGIRITPRRGAVMRTFVITMTYTAFVGIIDAMTGANYMFLRSPPPEWTLLRLLGPWPWYMASAAGLALVLLVVLDLPFWLGRRRAQRQPVG